MATEYAADTALHGLTRFFVVPHTHWDREWYVPFEEFQLRLAAVVDEVIDVLESDPSFTRFTLDGQAIVIEDYLDVRPENEGRLRALIEAGRLEVGPSYILPDELLVGAEPLVRNLLHRPRRVPAVRRRADARGLHAGQLRPSAPAPPDPRRLRDRHASSSRAGWATSSTRSGWCSGGARRTAARSARSSSCRRTATSTLPIVARRRGSSRSPTVSGTR